MYICTFMFIYVDVMSSNDDMHVKQHLALLKESHHSRAAIAERLRVAIRICIYLFKHSYIHVYICL